MVTVFINDADIFRYFKEDENGEIPIIPIIENAAKADSVAYWSAKVEVKFHDFVPGIKAKLRVYFSVGDRRDIESRLKQFREKAGFIYQFLEFAKDNLKRPFYLVDIKDGRVRQVDDADITILVKAESSKPHIFLRIDESDYKAKWPLVEEFWIDGVVGKIILTWDASLIVGRHGISWAFKEILKVKE